MKKVILLVILGLFNCKDFGQGKKSKTMSGSENAATVLLIDATLTPIPFRGSWNTKTPYFSCQNSFKKPSVQQTEGERLEPNRCSNKNVIGVCIQKSTVIAAEWVYYSGDFSLAEAKAKCDELKTQLTAGGTEVKILTEYDPNPVYLPLR
ncbi:MAG TPA: hypothetical protein PLJ29_05005 [Leptospiraceae bacterium]|nr:hypothetical protein [Leptospiraceae bacterium]